MKLPEIRGFVDLSLVDWDGKVSAVIFLPYCNFRCPFCYNTDLVLNPEKMPVIPFEEIVGYLARSKDWLDGVAITGGEPTTHEELPFLCKRIKELGLGVKLDTNGTHSTMIQRLIDQKLVDYVALDIKAPLTAEKYPEAIGTKLGEMLDEVQNTMQILLNGVIDYEFRTTLVPAIHSKNGVEQICDKIKGCRKYVLQNFRSDVETLDPNFKGIKAFSQKEMEELLSSAKRIVPNTFLR